MIDPTFKDKTALETNAGAEQIASAQPDCVIMKSTNVETLGKPLEALNIPVVYLDFETPDQYQRDLTTLGQLFQNPDRAKTLAAYYTDGLEKIKSVTSTLKEADKPRTLLLYYNEKDGAVAFNVPPMEWIQTLMVEAAGGTPVWKDANPGKGWTKVSLEQVAAWDPDVILIVAYFNPTSEVVAKLKQDPQWQALRAVKENKLYGFAKDIYSWDQPDPRWLLGLNWLAAKLNPKLCPDMEINQEALTFYQELYSMDKAAFEKDIQPVLNGE
ncbi:MAG: ABC transporter substrate-binding protein [Anaerolineae bacterium]|nr:ABC transporter substrate-binding protein [Anaerolineae bacterium]